VAFPAEGRAKFSALAARAEAEGMAALADVAMKRMFSDAFIAANPALIADRKAVYARIPPDVFAKAARALATLDFSPQLAKIRNPLLVPAHPGPGRVRRSGGGFSQALKR
jgi:3-oxoadipate enol-lactonase